jgi:predicted AlkP superfamily phosphohydrolase/phosphomutase
MRVLMLSLDGFDMETALGFGLPTLDRLASTAAHGRLDSGTTYLTGLAGEQLSNGLHPAEGGRQSAVSFDPETYTVSQEIPSLPPAFGGVDTVVLDPCYFDLGRTPETVRGIVDWGCHDPGGPPQQRPDSLRDEIIDRFGEYPARTWLYGFPWPTSDGCRAMAGDLVRAVQVRSAIARWLLTERFTDWQLAVVNVAEGHSASEGFFHGADPDHPLAGHASAPAARAGIREVYRAIDTLVAEMLDALPDVLTIVFSPHGMGTSNSDVPSMLLLGEVLARWSGRVTPALAFPVDDDGVAMLGPDDSWNDAMWRALDGRSTPTSRTSLPRWIRSRAQARRRRSIAPGVDWMPLVRHQASWPTMRAFALPSYNDGRVRVNLRGRESRGCVDPSEYESLLDDVESLLRACRDPATGESLVRSVDRPLDDPLTATDDSADLIVHWQGSTSALEHDRLGRIGPVPARRTGGHTSPYGAVFISGPGIGAVDLGDHSPFDLLPTAFELTGCTSPWPLSGRAFAVPSTAGTPSRDASDG